MKFAILSDIHDHLKNLASVLEKVRESGAECLLFLGDFCAPFTLAEIAKGFSGPVHAVLGNNDGDPLLLAKIASQHAHVSLHGQLAELDIAGRKIALNHYPEIAKRLAESQAYDAVFSGHDHRRYFHRIGKALWANPGEIMGRFGTVSFGIYDSETGGFEHILV
jgi:putative phosphoesterase